MTIRRPWSISFSIMCSGIPPQPNPRIRNAVLANRSAKRRSAETPYSRPADRSRPVRQHKLHMSLQNLTVNHTLTCGKRVGCRSHRHIADCRDRFCQQRSGKVGKGPTKAKAGYPLEGAFLIGNPQTVRDKIIAADEALRGDRLTDVSDEFGHAGNQCNAAINLNYWVTHVCTCAKPRWALAQNAKRQGACKRPGGVGFHPRQATPCRPRQRATIRHWHLDRAVWPVGGP